MLLLTAGTTRASIYGFAHLAQFLVFLEIIVSNPVREAGVRAASQKVRGGLRQQGSFPVPYRFSCANCKRVSLATVYSNTRTTIKSLGWDKGWRIRCLRRPNPLLRSFVEEKGDLRSGGSPLEVMMNEIVEIQAQDT